MADQQVTKDQHFVPSFYLKAFADARGTVRALDLRSDRRPGSGRILKPRPYQSVGYERFFYAQKTGVEDAISQDFEKLFGSIETQVADRLPEVLTHAEAGTLRFVHFDTLAYFMALQWLRTDAFRDFVNKVQESTSKRIMEVITSFRDYPDQRRREAAQEGNAMTDEEIAREQRFFQEGQYDLKFDNTMHLKFLTPDKLIGFHNMLLGQRWTVVRARTGHFVTSNNPVAVAYPKAQGFYGQSFLERTHCLPLTPQLLIETSHLTPPADVNDSDPSKTAQYRMADAVEVTAYNILNVRRAGKFAYSGSADPLKVILTDMTAGGPATRLYLERFEPPMEPTVDEEPA